MAYGEIQFLKGTKLAARGDLTAALFVYERAQIFPIYRIREASMTLFALTPGMPPEIVLVRIDGILEDDPYGPRLNFYKIAHEIRRGRLDLAHSALARLQQSLPGDPHTLDARRAYDTALNSR